MIHSRLESIEASVRLVKNDVLFYSTYRSKKTSVAISMKELCEYSDDDDEKNDKRTSSCDSFSNLESGAIL